MKRVLIIIIVLAFSIAIFAQQQLKSKEVPVKVQNGLKKKFAKTSKLVWRKDADENFVAEFEFNEKNVKAVFDSDGKWVETRTEMSEREVPANVKMFVKTKHRGYRITFPAACSNADGEKTLYIEINKPESSSAPVQLFFTRDGTPIDMNKVNEAKAKEKQEETKKSNAAEAKKQKNKPRDEQEYSVEEMEKQTMKDKMAGETAPEVKPKADEEEILKDNSVEDEGTGKDEEINPKELPGVVQDAIYNEYPDYKIVEAWLTPDDGVDPSLYKVKLKKKGYREELIQYYEMDGKKTER